MFALSDAWSTFVWRVLLSLSLLLSFSFSLVPKYRTSYQPRLVINMGWEIRIRERNYIGSINAKGRVTRELLALSLVCGLNNNLLCLNVWGLDKLYGNPYVYWHSSLSRVVIPRYSCSHPIDSTDGTQKTKPHWGRGREREKGPTE